MVHHGRLRRDASEIAQRPDAILGGHMPDGGCCLLPKRAASDHLDLLHQLMPINFRSILMLLQHADVIRSLGQHGALGALRNDDTTARQEISQLVDLPGDAETAFLLPGVSFLSLEVVHFLLFLALALRPSGTRVGHARSMVVVVLAFLAASAFVVAVVPAAVIVFAVSLALEVILHLVGGRYGLQIRDCLICGCLVGLVLRCFGGGIGRRCDCCRCSWWRGWRRAACDVRDGSVASDASGAAACCAVCGCH
mmetsp:Transcript_17630/g.49919  ORF Transcript_17630/g.49919 Transcript_17630/m.49919 type:complete len:252 (+) Transcript_17630:1213-1968(+)